ncbi:acyltransferase family protein [Streptomyces beihaiensis]|uniref:Acyltransferase family protein n=1 Tax=Streptomyces beihaiensis TaxID=2984495 RepID=A0ABT3TQB2_9ACTN|nr:acyltransferase family protein [Streptomyces beihaiensis]MCX3059214.1 acyltransferase family protein [Streptomyces beihaiensis]
MRDPFFDNAKFVLIVMVVIGHNWYPLIGDSRALKAAYMVVYSFHMPAFILLSGYFSRNFEGRPDQIRKLVKSTLVPYLVFEFVYLIVMAKADGGPLRFTVTLPSYMLWFLVALFFWRLTTPVWRAFSRPVLVAVLISLAAGLTYVSDDFAFTRILQFLPWFVAGLQLRREHFQWLRRKAVRGWAAAVAVLAVPVAYMLVPGADVHWLDMRQSADGLGVGAVEYVLVRLGLFVVSAILVATVLSLVPARRLWLTSLGALTMYPFLLHGMLVKLGEVLGVHDAAAAAGPLAIVGLTACAVCVAVLLTTPPVRWLTRWAVEPRMPRPPRLLVRPSSGG